MELKAKKINQKNVWEDFFSNCKEKTFLQSWAWGEFQEKMGNKIWRLGIYNKDNLIGSALVSKIKAKRGSFLLIQHGPNAIPEFKFQALGLLLKELKKIGKKEKCSFIRIASLWEKNRENKKFFAQSGLRKSPMHANAYEATLKLSLAHAEKELFGKMRKTTRYLIRKAEKNQDVSVEKSNRAEDLEKYQALNKEMAKRQNFAPFSQEYIKNEFEVFAQDNQSLLFLGKHKGKLAAGALIIFWSGIAFYHQAASGSKYARFSVPYLLLWEAIKEAKKRECSLFDFWGYVSPKAAGKKFGLLKREHPWAGPSLFKMGFGPEPKEYLETQDFPLLKRYWLIFVFEKLRKFKRHL